MEHIHNIYDIELLRYPMKAAESHLKYLNCSSLLNCLQKAKEREPDEIDCIATFCIMKNLDENILEMLSIFSQIRKVLVEAKYRLSGNIVQKWQEKVKMIELNPGLINYLTNMSQEEVKKEKKEEILARDKKENSLETIQQQLQKLDIVTNKQNQVISKQEEPRNNNYKANILAYNMPGENEEQCIKMIEVTFDCKAEKKEAIDKIEKKSRDWFRMIPKESKKPKKKENNDNETKKVKKEKKYKKQQEDWKAKYDSEEEEEERRRLNIDNEDRNSKYITLWDLPKDINQQEIQYAYREREAEILWAISIDDKKLARITEARLKELLKEASEILLLNKLRNKAAKSVYIPYNRNGWQRAIAIVTFENEENKDKATMRPVRYNNWEEKVLGARRKREEKEFSEESEYKKSEAEESAREKIAKIGKRILKKTKKQSKKESKIKKKQ
ncbi:2119_t:CDS:2, partial [Ambispora leptoticha]